ncbi:50S ribosomal protein L18, partial [Candidatus Omnitrophota bacterium]
MRKKFKNKAELRRIKRHYRIRKNAFGTKDKPRLSVHRSHKNLYVQFVDDLSNEMLLSLSTNDKAFKKDCA